MRVTQWLRGLIPALALAAPLSAQAQGELVVYCTVQEEWCRPMVEAFQKTREDIIGRQQQELLELSTPVVQLWEGILALPLIGTLDSERTQIVMESLLQEIVTSGAEIAIIESLAIQASKSLQEAQLMEVIQHQRRRFETAFRTVPIGMVIAEDSKAQKIRMNGAAAAMFELPSDENISLSTPAGTRLAQRVIAVNNLTSPEQLPLWRARSRPNSDRLRRGPRRSRRCSRLLAQPGSSPGSPAICFRFRLKRLGPP